MNWFRDVELFHRKFRLPVTASDRLCATMTDSVAAYRVDFLKEEMVELEVALACGDLAGQVDALIDLAWVAIGTLHYMGAPGEDAWVEVARANMQKELRLSEDPLHRRGPSEVIRKPVGWKPPNIEGVIQAHNASVRDAIARVTGRRASGGSPAPESGVNPSPQGEAP